jgi:poly(3-hydroxybutyrate) depolymerase
MPGRIVIDGVVREFFFHRPFGWRFWLRTALEKGRGGLPLVVMFPEGYVSDRRGGRRPEDPEQFILRWPLAQAWELDPNTVFTPRPPGDPLEDPPGVERYWDDQFFVLAVYPAGWRGLPKTDEHDVVPTDPGFPLLRRTGGWNPGGFTPNEQPQRDVRAVHRILELMERDLVQQYQLTPTTTAFDLDRKYLFGRGDGGMMALRLAHEDPNGTWAAIWVTGASMGGKASGLFGEEVVRNVPAPSWPVGYGLSLFAHHGGRDLDVPLAASRQTGPEDLDGTLLSVGRRDELVEAGMLVDKAAEYATHYLPLEELLEAYRIVNRLDRSLRNSREPGVAGPTTATRRQWGRPPLSVVHYDDPDMDHFDYYDRATPYFTPRQIWEFFKKHPRTPLPLVRP